MKKIFCTVRNHGICTYNVLIMLLLFMFLQNSIYAQNIRGEFIGGFNLAQVDGDEVVGYRKIGFNGGFGAALPFSKNWYVSVETIFNQKGAYKKYPLNSNNLSLPYYNLRLNYAEIPLLVHYNDKNQITAGLGLSYGRVVSMREIEHGNQIKWNSVSGPYNTDDFNILVDFRLKAVWKLYFNFRYAYSVSKIRTRHFDNSVNTWTRKQYNNLISFRLIFIFNEKTH